jgi:hypothetical protein
LALRGTHPQKEVGQTGQRDWLHRELCNICEDSRRGEEEAVGSGYEANVKLKRKNYYGREWQPKKGFLDWFPGIFHDLSFFLCIR